MKKYLILTTVIAIFAIPALAQETMNHDMQHSEHHMEGMSHMDHDDHADTDAQSVRQVDASMVCMMNNKVFDKAQIPVEINGKTYYGCCSMCKDMLTKDKTLRMATDPISGQEVDKASAILGADEAGKVYYFESETNLHKHMGH